MNDPYSEFETAIIETAEKLDKYRVAYAQIVLVPFETKNPKSRVVLFIGNPDEGHPHHQSGD